MNYNIKMRAQKDGQHITGAERIVSQPEIEHAVKTLLQRAQTHPNGTPDVITIKINQLPADIQQIPALKVIEPPIKNIDEAKAYLQKELEQMNLPGKEILEMLYTLKNMRGAVLLDIKTLKRLEADPNRGIRASNMDYEGNTGKIKNHHKEALTLASKVANSPYIIGELCISDDTDYTTGYMATKERGYIRIANIKKAGDPIGGRIFLYNGKPENIKECISYLENHPVKVQIKKKKKEKP